MKAFAIILSTYILFLAILPVGNMALLITGQGCCQDVCKEEVEEHSEEESEGCNEICNPFLSCQCNIGFTTVKTIPSVYFDALEYDVRSYRNELLYPASVIFRVWNPPKV